MPTMPKIHVPQKDGEITLTTDEPRTYGVSEHLVSVPTADVATFLSLVPGSRPADEKARDAAQDPPST